MSFNQNDTVLVGGTQVIVGLSTILKVSAQPFQNSFAFKILSGGTLSVVAPPIALSGSSAIGWTGGYPLGTSEALGINGPATFYLAASGSTVTFALLISHTVGMTVSI